MKLTLGQLLAAEEALKRLSEQKTSVLIAYRLSLVLKQVNEFLTPFYEQRLQLARRYGVEDKGVVTIPPDRAVEFAQALAPLLNEVVELKFTPFEVEDIKGEISAQDLLNLGWLFNDKTSPCDPSSECEGV